MRAKYNTNTNGNSSNSSTQDTKGVGNELHGGLGAEASLVPPLRMRRRLRPGAAAAGAGKSGAFR